MRIMPKTLYRPRGTDKKTGRQNWVTKEWYESRKDAAQVMKMLGSQRWFKDIKIISAPNRTYKGKWIRDQNISKMF